MSNHQITNPKRNAHFGMKRQTFGQQMGETPRGKVTQTTLAPLTI